MNLPLAISNRINAWLTSPESNAAGRMSLFRIVYGLYYLWTTRALSYYSTYWVTLPQDQWDPIPTLEHLNIGRPGAIWFIVMPIVLLVSLTLLTIGYHTRLATLLVLISGTFISGVYYSFTGKIDHGDTFLVAYIPAIMLFSRWNSNYSVDALLKERRGVRVSPADTSWLYSWPMRVVLLLLALMYLGAGYLKIRGGWLTDLEVFSKILLNQNAIAVMNGHLPNPLSPIIAHNSLLHTPLQLIALSFEFFFPLALVHRYARTLFISMGLIFHFSNWFLLNINGWTLIIIYLTFIDWQLIYSRFWRFRLDGYLRKLPTQVLVGISLGLAAITPVLWISTNPLRPPSALLNLNVMWYAALSIALISLAVLGYEVLAKLRVFHRFTPYSFSRLGRYLRRRST